MTSRWPAALVSAIVLAFVASHCTAFQARKDSKGFEIENNAFVKDGRLLQIISGRCVAYFAYILTTFTLNLEKRACHDGAGTDKYRAASTTIGYLLHTGKTDCLGQKPLA